MQMKSAFAIASGIALAVISGHSTATTLFADDFQTNNLSVLWGGAPYPCSSGSSAFITTDPLVSGGHALAFNRGNCWSDIVTTNMFSSASGIFNLSFDYMHVGAGEGFGTGGGFLGWADGVNFGQWLHVGSPQYGGHFPSDQWVHIDVTFNSNVPINIFIEQWGGQSETPGSALFKNLILTDENGPSASVPEPGSIALLGLGLLGFAVSRRRKSA